MNPYLQDLDEQALALLQSTGATPEDYIKDPSLAGGATITNAATRASLLDEELAAPDLDSAPVESVPESAPSPADPYASIREQAIRNLLKTKYPDRAKKDDGTLLGREGSAKVNQALYAANVPGKKLPDDFFKPAADPALDDGKRANFEITRANALAGLLGKHGVPRTAKGGDKDAAALVAWVKSKRKDVADSLGPSLETTDVDTLNKILMDNSRMTNTNQREDFHGDKNEQWAQMFEEKKRRAGEDERFRALKFDYGISQDAAGYFAKFDTATKDHQLTVGALEQIEKAAPGLTRGIVTPDVEISLSTLERAKQSPRLLGFWNQMSPDERTQKHAMLDSKIRNLSSTWLKSMSGAAVTDEEFKRMDAVLQRAIGQPPEVQAAAIAMLRELTARRVNQAWASNTAFVRPEDMERYKASGLGLVGGEGILSVEPVPGQRPAPAAKPVSAPGVTQNSAAPLDPTLPGAGRPTIPPGPAADSWTDEEEKRLLELEAKLKAGQ